MRLPNVERSGLNFSYVLNREVTNGENFIIPTPRDEKIPPSLVLAWLQIRDPQKDEFIENPFSKIRQI